MEVIPVDLENTLGKNPALTVPYHPVIPFKREEFYRDLSKGDIKTVVDSYIEKYKQRPALRLKIKNLLRFVKRTTKASRWHLKTFWHNIYYNLLNKNIDTNILEGKFLILHPYCLFEMDKSSKLKIGGIVNIGYNFYKGEKKYTKILLRKNAVMDIKGEYAFFSGCDIQVHDNAIFTVEGGGDTNMNVEVVCGNSITFQKYVYVGRNVIIRDTNGEHFISRQGYKTSRPVVIGTHAWLCDRATIMPGVHVKPGGIVGANTYVTSDVEAFTMVSGNPARVVDEEVYWKA